MVDHRRCFKLPVLLALFSVILAASDSSSPAVALTRPLQWVSPIASTNLRIGRLVPGSRGGAVPVDEGLTSKFCAGTVSLPEGSLLSCKLTDADTAYQYLICARSQSGEFLSAIDCSYHGNGGGWECAPSDIGAGWCD